MTLFFRIIFKIFLILTILIGCATTEKIKETDPDAIFKQGTMHAEKGEYTRSIAYFNKTIEINPRYAEAYHIRGVAYGKKGQYDKAISDFNKAIEINPRYAEAYYNRGNVRKKIWNIEMACSDWRRACELGSCEAYELAKRKGLCK